MVPSHSPIMVRVRVSSRGRVTIPKALRDQYQIRLSDEVEIIDRGDGILIRPQRPPLRGRLRGLIDANGMEEDIRQLRREWSL